MKKLVLAGVILLCFMSDIHAQRFQATAGLIFNDEKWAVIEDGGIGRFVTIGNTNNADNFSRIWIASYTPAGAIVTSATTTNNRRIMARDICLAPRDPNNAAFPATYYVTGWTVSNTGVNQMFVGRMNLSGAFLWYRESGIAGTAPPNDEEGVAIAMAPNGDAVVAGNIKMPVQGNIPAGPRVKLARFSPAGATLWSNVYNTAGNWKVREIANAAPVPNCTASPTNMPGEFIITGEVSMQEAPGGFSPSRTFAAVYNGAGTECWRNLYPVTATASTDFTGDAGYDVVLRPAGNYVIAGVAQMGQGRAVATSTPYFVEVNASGALVTAAIYLNRDSRPLGLYPRCIARGQTSPYLVCAGPDFADKNTFFMRISSVGGAAILNRYPGIATANSIPQPFYLDDAQPEGILSTTLGPTPGYLISTNAIPGVFGGSDGHLIKTDVSGLTPSACPRVAILHLSKKVGAVITSKSTPIPVKWTTGQVTRNSFAIQQKFCRDGCKANADFKDSITCRYKVILTNTSTGTGLTYNWLFDDGTTSTAVNPVKTFSTCGPHVIRLIACDSVCCDTIVKTVNIPCCEVKSDFCLQDSGKYVKLIYNPAMNLPPTTYTVFLDGVTTPWPANSNKLLTPGLHTICLKARRVSCPGDTCCATCCKTINVASPCTMKTDFWYQVQSGGTVVFTNKTTPAGFTSLWNFGDGTPTSATTNPVHTYAAPGTYTACLTTTIITGTDTCLAKVCRKLIIEKPCKPTANFMTKYCVATPLTVQFTNLSSVGSYLWNFGDGTTSVAVNPIHNYGAPGSYLVCLTVTASSTCWSKTCYKVVVSTSSCDTSCSQLPKPPVVNNSPVNNVMILESAVSNSDGVVKDNTSELKSKKAVEDEEAAVEKLSLFPNPASQGIQVVFETNREAPAEITVMTALGSLVYKRPVSFVKGINNFSIPLQAFASGNYFLKINSGSNTHSAMFIVKH